MDEKIKELEDRIAVLETTIAEQVSLITAIQAMQQLNIQKWEERIEILENEVAEQKSNIDLKVDKHKIVEQFNFSSGKVEG